MLKKLVEPVKKYSGHAAAFTAIAGLGYAVVADTLNPSRVDNACAAFRGGVHETTEQGFEAAERFVHTLGGNVVFRPLMSELAIEYVEGQFGKYKHLFEDGILTKLGAHIEEFHDGDDFLHDPDSHYISFNSGPTSAHLLDLTPWKPEDITCSAIFRAKVETQDDGSMLVSDLALEPRSPF